ncbi:L(+)-tartrate dehydratase subunit alpha [Methanobrevibacter cuticularis]|uniref:L(+)-tartrate dehydratase subunit alpha n=1 Tax=Methanobrevibacter cuticularis TaxID=47311 RepID=A0A166DGH3_9EURY|nr:fumarate hydratase [Methanobrevibacter cuticularis]KZX15576.1 L(+)-tartrate dehydratase subunit alpha [Methanobrevibacter cuticularis]
MKLINDIEKALIDASTSYPKDRIAAFKRALNNEEDENAIWALELMIKNAEIANLNKLPLCDDTGIPHVFIELGKDRLISHDFLVEIKEGISNGLKNLPGRPMAVKGNSIERIEQSKGLYDKSEMIKPPSILIDNYDGDNVKIHLLLLGGGPEIRANTYRVFHKRSYKEVLNIATERIIESLPLLGCTPSIPAIGIGRTHFEANSLLIKAMIYGNLDEQSDIETYLTNKINKANIGPMGLGGKTTAIGSFINIGHQRASGVRVVATRPCCFVEPRVATLEII